MPIYPHSQDTKDFRDLEAGDETHRHADYIPYDWTEDAGLEVGDLVAANADEELVAYDSAATDQTLLGVLYSYYTEGRDGDVPRYDLHATVKVGGAAVVNVPDADTLAAGETVDQAYVLHVSEDGNYAELRF